LLTTIIKRFEKNMLLELLLIILIVIILVVVFFGYYNKIIRLENRIDNSWAQIDVQLKRRADLIPNLMETVKGYMRKKSLKMLQRHVLLL
jgi:LemA protein